MTDLVSRIGSRRASAGYEFSYTPDGVQLGAFLGSNAFVRGLRGPIGSGKSVTCAVEALRRAGEQQPGPDGVRKSRMAVIRNTGPQLKTTTIKTWLDWFPEAIFGKFRWDPPFTHWMRVGDIELEAIFLALDKPSDVSKLLSLELTFAWINEAREVPKAIIDAATSRVNRFPSRRDGGATWSGVWMDTNAPDEMHWWPIMAGDVPLPDHISEDEALTLVKPKNWAFFTQPAGMLEVKDGQGRVTGYVQNPEAENRHHLAPDYYPNLIQGKTRAWINVYVRNQLGAITDGKAVHPTFSRETHVARQALAPLPNLPIEFGIDFGLTPAALFGQRTPRGRWLILAELVAIDTAIEKFREAFYGFVARRFPDNPLGLGWGDPSGDFRAQTDDRTPFMVFNKSELLARPCYTNDPVIRLGAVDNVLSRLVDGQPALQIDPECKTYIQGFEGGYHFRRLNVTGSGGSEQYEPEPFKNRYSHIHDAGQYLFAGGGEGQALTRRKGGARGSTVAQRPLYDPFARQRGDEGRPASRADRGADLKNEVARRIRGGF